MKLHEQQWQTSEGEGRTVETRAGGWRVAEAYPGSEHGGVAEQFEVGRFIADAPTLARHVVKALTAHADVVETPKGRRIRLWLDVNDVMDMHATIKRVGGI